ncbi:MAG: hypothetical protein PHR35_01990 [Kiritimatiellae bacterium]|nr:hypothetical protein [Kiritimatiellia bacterium]
MKTRSVHEVAALRRCRRGGTLAGLAAAIMAMLLGARGTAQAQLLAFDMRPKYGSYVVGEPVWVDLRLVNRGASPIVIDDHEVFRHNRIFFEISIDPQVYLNQSREGRIVDDLDLGKNEPYAAEIDLGAWYPLLREGRYFANAVLLHNDLRYATERRMFDVVPGIELSRATAIISTTPRVERRFSLVYWARGEREYAFLRATDTPDGVVWPTLELGPIVRFTPPSIALNDPDGVTVTHQATRAIFMTSTIRSDRNGILLLSQKQTVDSAAEPLIKALSEAVGKRQKGKDK